MSNRINIRKYVIKSIKALDQAEDRFRIKDGAFEQEVYARDTHYDEIAETVIPDRVGSWKTPLTLYVSTHKTIIGARNLCRMTEEFITKTVKNCDILSIQAVMGEKSLVLCTLLRLYDGEPNVKKFFEYIKDDLYEKDVEEGPAEGKLLIPDSVKNFKYSAAQLKEHKAILTKQKQIYDRSDINHPFLNSIKDYEPVKLKNPADTTELKYDLLTKDKQIKIIGSYEDFNRAFVSVMEWVTGTEYNQYVLSLSNGEDAENEFIEAIKSQVKTRYIEKGRLPRENFPALMDKLYRALYQLYIIQDFIDDPNITDILVTAPDAIRVRMNGKTYLSNVTFVNMNDYRRFIDMIAIRNGIKLNIPEQTFTDSRDENYILRFSITAAYVNSVDYPYLHIRKISRNKLLGKDLINAGMFDEKIMKYLLDCGKYSTGIVFAGPPGSGKTVALNWFLEEAYESSADVLVIQENDELFAYRKGVRFQHSVLYPTDNNKRVTLEELGQLALVEGANVFVIGEAKGAEICSAITLSNSGCRTAITIHSPSSTETIDKMVDLAMRGENVKSPEQAMRMLKTFQTIVYLQDFKVQEISEITGYDEERHNMKYRYIYRRESEDADYEEGSTVIGDDVNIFSRSA